MSEQLKSFILIALILSVGLSSFVDLKQNKRISLLTESVLLLQTMEVKK